MSLEQDWERVCGVWKTFRDNHWCPRLVLFIDIRDLRVFDRGIDYPLRRLMDSRDYSHRIRLHGGPPSTYPRFPFRWGGKVWALIEIPELQLHRGRRHEREKT